MSKFNDGAAALDRVATQYKALIGLADTLRELGSLEQAAGESQAARDQAVKQRDAALRERDAHVAARDQALVDLEVARKAFEKECATDRAKAKGLVEKAEAKAADLVAAAETRAVAVAESAKLVREQAQKELDDLRAEGQRLAVQNQVAAENLDELTKRYDKTKAQIAALIS